MELSNNHPKNHLVIQCWTGRILFQGHYKDKEVDKTLDANRCTSKVCGRDNKPCKECDDTGYKGDFEVYWLDEKQQDESNVCEYINY